MLTLKKHHSISFVILSILTAIAMPATGQENQQNAKALLLKVQNAYRQASSLGFHVKYKYANSNKPDTYLDSLSGEVEMDKNRFRFVIDGTETMVTDKYTIYVMNDDKIIYLSSARHSNLMDPVGLLDTMLAHIEAHGMSIATNDHSEMLTMTFPPGQMYSRIKMTIDSRTGWLQDIQYILYTAGLVGQEMIERPGHAAPYQSEGMIDIMFSHYRERAFGNTLFNPENFFTRIGNNYQPVEKYKDYRIFLASPNLQ